MTSVTIVFIQNENSKVLCCKPLTPEIVGIVFLVELEILFQFHHSSRIDDVAVLYATGVKKNLDD